MPVTRASLEDTLAQLAVQRERYALAMSSTTNPRARERHARTVARLDEEILGLREALDAVDGSVDRSVAEVVPTREDSPWQFTDVDQRVGWDDDDDAGPIAPAVPRWALATAAAVAGAGILWIALLG